MPVLQLTAEGEQILRNYSWPGNVRQLKNITEQMSVLEENREISAETLSRYIPSEGFSSKPMIVGKGTSATDFTEREILYKVLFDMKNDLNDLKKLVGGLMQSGVDFAHDAGNAELIQRVFSADHTPVVNAQNTPATGVIRLPQASEPIIEVEETLSLQNSERELIEKALKKHRNKRKYAAEELGISERTLYRKIKEYNLT
jgi:DNA-binding NtrC family response regulator